ncbi:MAG: transcription elongation factor GreAB [Lacunisphaera sp.]|nr:transcription elongation factor GreAB [Lacunisphaera sp.]
MPAFINKRDLIARSIAKLAIDLEQLTTAALATHAEATNEENKAEDKYDTRGLEASYLAHGQSKAAEQAAQAVAQFQKLPIRDLSAGEPISLGALVVLEGQSQSHYFIGPRAGGTEIRIDGRTVMVITPQSPLGRQLMGRKQGDTLQLDLGGQRNEFLVASVV